MKTLKRKQIFRFSIVTRVLAGGGAENVAIQIANWFSENEIQTQMIVLQHSEIPKSINSAMQISYVKSSTKNLIYRKTTEYLDVRRKILEFKPDIVLAMPEDVGIYLIFAMLGTKIPIVVSERNNPWLLPYRKFSRIFRRIMYPFATGFVFQTEFARSYFSNSVQKKGCVLPNPLNVSGLPVIYEGVRDKTIIGAGRLVSQKNFTLLIKAFAIFQSRFPDYKLIIFGEGPQKNDLLALAENLLIPNSYEFPGRVPNLPEKISKASIFVLSSDYEGFPNVLIESLSMGIPSISTDYLPGGANTLIKNGINGYVTPVGDIEELAKAMGNLIMQPEILPRTFRSAIAIREKYASENVIRLWKEYMIRLI